jgi:hypothetical protein
MAFSAKKAVMCAAVTAATLGVLPFSGGAAFAENLQPTVSAPLTSPARIALDCSARELQGSGGHWGEEITCRGGWFRGAIWCKRFDNGAEYIHRGPVSGSGGTSTVWCDLGARVESWFVEQV